MYCLLAYASCQTDTVHVSLSLSLPIYLSLQLPRRVQGVEEEAPLDLQGWVGEVVAVVEEEEVG